MFIATRVDSKMQTHANLCYCCCRERNAERHDSFFRPMREARQRIRTTASNKSAPPVACVSSRAQSIPLSRTLCHAQQSQHRKSRSPRVNAHHFFLCLFTKIPLLLSRRRPRYKRTVESTKMGAFSSAWIRCEPLLLLVCLQAVVAFHPRRRRVIDRLTSGYI